MVVDCIQDKASLVKYFLSPGIVGGFSQAGALGGSLKAFLRVHCHYLSGGSLVTTTDEPLSGWSVTHPTSAHVGDCKGGGLATESLAGAKPVGPSVTPPSLHSRAAEEIRGSRCRKVILGKL